MDLFAEDLEFVKIATDKMEGGDELMESLMKGRQGGMPWSVILNGDGEEVISSNDKDGKNIGCPVAEHEIAHFVEMIKTATNRPEDHIAKVLAAMEKHAEALKN